MAQNLFALSQASVSAGGDSNKPLVTFKAGKMTFQNGTVAPINKKGQVSLLTTPDSLMHFQWKDRSTGAIEDDLIIFPEEATFSRVTQCSSGRVFLLRFKASDRKLFFWMQESKEDKDKEYETKINEYINNPPNPDQPAGLSESQGTSNPLMRQMFQNPTLRPPISALPRLPVLSPQAPRPAEPGSVPQSPSVHAPSPLAISQPAPSAQPSAQSAPALPVPTITTSRPPTTQPSAPVPSVSITPAPQSTAEPSQADILKSILSNMGVPQNSQEDIDLSEVLAPDYISSFLMSDKDAQQALLPFLPTEANAVSDLRDLVHSPQFMQVVDSFSDVVHSGQGNDLLLSFGINPAEGGPLGVTTLESFVKALVSAADKKSARKQ